VERHYPYSSVEVVEIDNNLDPGKEYDLIYGDAFNDLSVP
jgi:hypothetical protein